MNAVSIPVCTMRRFCVMIKSAVKRLDEGVEKDMIRNIIFDVGKVLVSYEPDAYMQRLGISKENQKKINEAMFQNKLWDTSDQGLGTPDEFLQKFIAGAPELADEITKIHKTVGNTVELFPYAMEWILDLKARGYHVYILSNYSENMLDQTKDKLKFLPLMDGVVFSYKIKENEAGSGNL